MHAVLHSVQRIEGAAVDILGLFVLARVADLMSEAVEGSSSDPQPHLGLRAEVPEPRAVGAPERDEIGLVAASDYTHALPPFLAALVSGGREYSESAGWQQHEPRELEGTEDAAPRGVGGERVPPLSAEIGLSLLFERWVFFSQEATPGRKRLVSGFSHSVLLRSLDAVGASRARTCV